MDNKTSAKPIYLYVRNTQVGCFIITLGNPNNANSILLARCDGLAAVHTWLKEHDFKLTDCKL